MRDEIVDLAGRLISIPSISGDRKNCQKILSVVKGLLGRYRVDEFEKDGVESLLVYNDKGKRRKFKVILNLHLDVVEGEKNQFSPVEKSGKLFGRGANDMKASAAVMMLVFSEIADKISYPLALQITTDEEIGGLRGTLHQIKSGVEAEFILAGEPTSFDIAYKAKGILWLKITATGKSAHSAYPWKGVNALWRMNDFLQKLKRVFEFPEKESWVSTVNLSRISTENQTMNTIPSSCEAFLDIRYTPEEEGILRKIKKILPADFSLEVLLNEPCAHIDKDNPFVKKLKKTARKRLRKDIRLYGAQGASDVRHYTHIKKGGVEFGPQGGGSHTEKEWVSISSLEDYYHILKDYLLEIENL